MGEYQRYTAEIEAMLDFIFTFSVWETSPGEAAIQAVRQEEGEDGFGGDFPVTVTDKEGNVTHWLVHSVHTPVVYTVESVVK